MISSSQNWTIQVYLFFPDFTFSSSNAAPHLYFLLFAFTSFRLPSLHWHLLPWQSNNIPAIPFENFPPIQLQLFCSRTFLGFPCASSQCRSSPREGSRVRNTLFISSDRSSLRYDAPLSYFHSANPKVAQDSINAPVFHCNNWNSYFHMSKRIHVYPDALVLWLRIFSNYNKKERVKYVWLSGTTKCPPW